MGSRGCPLPPEGRGWGAAKSPYGGGSAGGPAVAWCSGSVVIVTGGTNTAASAAGRFEVSQDRQEQVEQRRLAAGQLREVGDDQSVVTVERDEPVAAPADPEARVGVVAEDAPDDFERGLEYTLVVVANFGSFPFDDPGLGTGPNRNRDAQASGLRHPPVVNDIE